MVKVKYKGQWRDMDEVAALREQERQAPQPAAPVDVATLPERQDLDPDVPLEQLFYERPEVRPYITKDGKMRSGLAPSEQEIAQEILKRYGDRA